MGSTSNQRNSKVITTAKTLKWSAVITAMIIIAVIIFVLTTQTNPSNILKPPSTQSIYSRQDYTQPSTPPEKIASSSFTQIAWIPDWAIVSNLEFLTANASYLDQISPVWYYLESDGKVKTNPVRRNELQKIAIQNNIALIPSIASFSADGMRATFESSAKVAAHVEFLIQEVDKYDYQGLDIDYESFPLTSQNGFLEFLRQLGDELHKRNKLLTIAVIPNWTEDQAYTALSQTRKVQDLSLIAGMVDQVRLMTYDFTGAYTATPGPTAPLDWQESVIRYTLRHVPSSKVVLGINLYGYVWKYDGKDSTDYATYLEYAPKGDAEIYSLTLPQMMNRKEHSLYKLISDHKSQEDVFVYRRDNDLWKAFAPSVSAIDLRMQLAKNYGLAGVAYWQLGGATPEVLKLIDKYR